MRRTRIPGARAVDGDRALGDERQIVVLAPDDHGPLVFGERQPENQIGFPAPC
jgi:hypothetical protein